MVQNSEKKKRKTVKYFKTAKSTVFLRGSLHDCIPFDFAVFKIIFPVFLADFTKHPTGIPHRNHIGGNILCDNTARTDYGIVPDANPGNNHRTRTNPAVFSDVHGHIKLIGFRSELRQIGCPAVATVTFGPNIVLSPT